MRNTGKLKSDSTLKSSGRLGGGGQLIPLKSLSAKKRLKARSGKKSLWFKEQRAPFVADYLERNPRCVFKLWIHGTTVEESPPLNYVGSIVTSCGKLADDVHERLPQGRGGRAIPTDGEEGNFCGLCRPHHIWVTANPKEARKLGYTL